jgi:hypothetical protein
VQTRALADADWRNGHDASASTSRLIACVASWRCVRINLIIVLTNELVRVSTVHLPLVRSAPARATTLRARASASGSDEVVDRWNHGLGVVVGQTGHPKFVE